ncbi:MAG: hydroxymyristoyl-ACP dehydratase [Proteobacteria bacterium]|uniref:hydroxymyristoyl-ACP dehydratase n=1 Tax=Rudaea sp. TaxID=2136325 RepID=UPI0032206921|nr:hydroxymyristoyl-ACP dehydratase [Pseudomonadota bacterium]
MNPTRFRIAADHPALPGHFPGRPVVPGVVVLDRVAAAIERASGARVAALPQVKFLAPLLPEQEAELCLEEKDKKIHFSVFHNGAMIASGVAVTEAPA